MDHNDPTLKERVETLRQAQANEELETARLRELGAANDPSVNPTARRKLAIGTFLLSLVFVFMSLSPLGMQGFEDGQLLFLVSALLLIPVVFTIWLFRRKLIFNVHGHRAVLAVTSAMAAVVIHRGIAWHYEQPAFVTIIIDMLLIAMATINTAPSLKRGTLIAALALLFIPVCMVFPKTIQAVGVVCCVINGILLYEWGLEGQRFTSSGED